MEFKTSDTASSHGEGHMLDWSSIHRDPRTMGEQPLLQVKSEMEERDENSIPIPAEHKGLRAQSSSSPSYLIGWLMHHNRVPRQGPCP